MILLIDNYDSFVHNLARYVSLLHENAMATYRLKLEFGDGRWDVAESDLARRPQVGDVLSLESGEWCVRGSQFVRPSVAGNRGLTELAVEEHLGHRGDRHIAAEKRIAPGGRTVPDGIL